MKKFSFILAIGLLLSSILVACGGPAGPSKSLDVTMTDFMFSPNTFTVPAGRTDLILQQQIMEPLHIALLS